jgi:protease-4
MRLFSLLPLLLAMVLLSGCGTPSLLITPVQNTNALHEETVEPGRGWFAKKIAIIPVDGMLANARSDSLLGPSENAVSLFVQELRQAANDPDVKAVVLRVNSPGGTVSSADAMYQELQRFRQRTGKPVVASAQEVAASGAYYVCCGADRIIAQPTSLVGSVGVIFEAFDFQGTLYKLGGRSDPIMSGTLKDMGSPFRQRTPQESKIMQEMVDSYFHRFLGVVEDNRHLADAAALKEISTGRVFTGEQALKLGLVDGNGLLDDAIQLAKKLANEPKASVVLYRRPYGYGGSIYANANVPTPQARTMQLKIPFMEEALPPGFYYLWRP